MNPDTSEFLDGYDEWYNNLPSPGGQAEIEKLKGGKMKEWIKDTKLLLRKFHIKTPDWCIDDEIILKLIAEIERSEAVREAAENVEWQKVWDIIHFFMLDEKTIEEKKSEIVKHLNQISKLQQALAAKEKDEKSQ